MNLTSIGFQRPKFIEPGQQIIYQEDVFKKHDKKFQFAGHRKVIVRVISAGIPGNFLVEIIRSKGVNAFPVGVKIEKPVPNLLRGFLISDDQAILFKSGTEDGGYFKSGGHLEGNDNGKKVVLDNADKGGMSVGATHSAGGIKGTVEGGSNIEFENREATITYKVNTDPVIDTFNGQKMTGKQVLSAINVDNGGKAFDDGGTVGTDQNPVKVKPGTVILTAPVESNPKKYDYNGKQMTGLEIASTINKRNEGVGFAAGGALVCSHGCGH